MKLKLQKPHLCIIAQMQRKAWTKNGIIISDIY